MKLNKVFTDIYILSDLRPNYRPEFYCWRIVTNSHANHLTSDFVFDMQVETIKQTIKSYEKIIKKSI